ncbi:MAG: AGE family epimerase/isomerase [Henriciella sp.]
MSAQLVELKQRAKLAESWLYEASFPFWAERARHSKTGFVEAVRLDGSSLPAAGSRVRVQARQTYSFALAASLGWKSKQARDLVDYGVDALVHNCRRADGLYGKVLNHDGGLLDDAAQLYDTAFALLAFATTEKQFPGAASAPLASVIAAIEAHLRRPAHEEGFAETLPKPESRNQNPHMHLFEASLASFELDHAQSELSRVREIEQLMEQRFFDPAVKGLRELFAADWGAHPADHFEVGHQYEWVWLLNKRMRLYGSRASTTMNLLYKKAVSLTGPDGEIYLSHNHDGSLKSGSQRCWGLTEALKAHLVQFTRGDIKAGQHAIAAFDRLWSMHIAPAAEGGWIDQYNQDGNAVSKDIPASTGYHIYLAFAELQRVVDQLSL